MAKFEVLCAQCGTVETPAGKPKGSGPAEAVIWIGSALLFVFTMWLASIAIGAQGGNLHPMRNSDAEIIGILSIVCIAGFFAAVVYSIARRVNRTIVCKRCSSPNVMPTNTPVAQQKLQEAETERMRKKYGDEVAAYRQQIRSEIGRAPAQ